MNKLMMVLAQLLSLGVLANAAAAQDAELYKERSKKEQRFANTFPPGVKTIACISPASYPGSSLHRRGVELLKQAGYKVKVLPHAFTPPEPGKSGAPLKDRLEDFYAAWNDPEVDMILCIRGGRGSADLLAALDWKKLKKRDNLYLQGYSDVTLITAAMLAKGYGRPVAGPMCGSMAGLQQECIDEMKAMHHDEAVGPVPVKKMKGGDCSGLAFTGLLSRLATAAQSDYCPSMAGRIIFIEVVSSTPKKMREDFQTLLDRKFFDGAAGVVFCYFLRSGKPAEMEAAMNEFASKLSVPVYRGFPFGHSSKCYTIDFSRRVEIKDSKVTFLAAQPAGK